MKACKPRQLISFLITNILIFFFKCCRKCWRHYRRRCHGDGSRAWENNSACVVGTPQFPLIPAKKQKRTIQDVYENISQFIHEKRRNRASGKRKADLEIEVLEIEKLQELETYEIEKLKRAQEEEKLKQEKFKTNHLAFNCSINK